MLGVRRSIGFFQGCRFPKPRQLDCMGEVYEFHVQLYSIVGIPVISCPIDDLKVAQDSLHPLNYPTAMY